MKITVFYEEFEDGSASTFKFESDFVPRAGDFIHMKSGVASRRENDDGSFRKYWGFVVDHVSMTVGEAGALESICLTVRPIENV